jgi:nucleotide-binding universal stress UspA family protein/DNA uptake protein ComE-like DNA-binding protein
MNRRITHRRGSIFILALCITFVMISLVLVLCRQMRVEVLASANEAGTVQAAAIERGAEAYCIELIDQQTAGQIQSVYLLAVQDPTYAYFYKVPMGPDPAKPVGYFWIVRPYYDNGQGQPDPSLPLFGLVDESSKLNVNLAPIEMLQLLPGLDQYPDIADSIVDWRDTDDDPTDQGVEDSYYGTLDPPYHCKNAPYESLEEMLLVKGVTRELLYGEPGNPPLGVDGGLGNPNIGFGDDPQLVHGLYDLLTVYGAPAVATASAPATGAAGRAGGGVTAAATVPKINPLTAPRSVLMCLPGVTSQVADQLISARQQAQSGGIDITTTDWAVQALGGAGQGVSQYLTATSSQYSADIVAATADGRSFRHVKIVIDTTTSPPRIVFRKDLTEQGWPLDPQILAELRMQPGSVANGGAGAGTGKTTNRPGT